MGLDQFAKARKEGKKEVELACWRKHPNLQGWMEALYHKKGGEGSFNCEEVELTASDIDDLEVAIKGQDLPETSGFFFGSDADDYYREMDYEFIFDAKEYINAGYTVVYDSWW